ncbi:MULTISPECIES: hypothetical protein [Pseudofrankia]|uniref:hypothetical protein n=1 Tax=Pseudofrankia TaxID=2994363 RepID=UPI000234C84C|nr:MULTISPECIES: hypothetical protein [Pseudofrankia]OHV36461.1 hypothetical protein BCD49_19720 [Pseudofrankia sp. EUN1h]
MIHTLLNTWPGYLILTCAGFGAAFILALAWLLLVEELPRLRVRLREAVSYRLHLLLILALSRLLKLEVAREISKDAKRRDR